MSEGDDNHKYNVQEVLAFCALVSAPPIPLLLQGISLVPALFVSGVAYALVVWWLRTDELMQLSWSTSRCFRAWVILAVSLSIVVSISILWNGRVSELSGRTYFVFVLVILASANVVWFAHLRNLLSRSGYWVE